mgnify:CR=1 FL=1
MAVYCCEGSHDDNHNKYNALIPPTPVPLGGKAVKTNEIRYAATHFVITGIILLHFIVMAYFGFGPRNIIELFSGDIMIVLWIPLVIAAIIHFIMGIVIMNHATVATNFLKLIRNIFVICLCIWLATLIIILLNDTSGLIMLILVPLISHIPVSVIYIILINNTITRGDEDIYNR